MEELLMRECNVLGIASYKGAESIYKVGLDEADFRYITKEFLVKCMQRNLIRNAIVDLNGAIKIDGDIKREEWTNSCEMDRETKIGLLRSIQAYEGTFEGCLSITAVSDFGRMFGYFEDEHFWLDSAKVEEEYRHIGMGTLMYKVVEDIIKDRKLTNKIRLEVVSTTAILFWKKQGYKLERYYLEDGDYKFPERAVMYKDI